MRYSRVQGADGDGDYCRLHALGWNFDHSVDFVVRVRIRKMQKINFSSNISIFFTFDEKFEFFNFLG